MSLDHQPTLSNGVRASTWTYPITAHRRCHCSRPPRVAWHTPPLLPNEKDARWPHKKDREAPDRPLAPSRGSGALPTIEPRPSDPKSHWGTRQTNPQARGAYKKLGELLTALSPRVEARRLFLQPYRDPAALARTRMGSTNKPSVRTKRICEGRMKKSGDPRPSSCSRRRLGGSSCTQRPRQTVQAHARGFITKHDKRAPSPLLSRGSKARPPRGFDSRLRATESGTTSGQAYEWPRPERAIARGVLSRIRDRQGSLRMGSHRREAPSHRGPANGLGTH